MKALLSTTLTLFYLAFAAELIAQPPVSKQTEEFAELNERIEKLVAIPDADMTAKLHRELAAAYQSTGKRQLARNQFDAAIAKAPSDVENFIARGYFLTQESLSASTEDFRKAVELEPNNAAANAGLGAVLAASDQPNEAETFLQTALQQSPRDSQALANLAEVQRQLGKPELALKSIGEAIQLDPNTWRHFYVQGLVLQNLDQLAEAVDSYSRGIRLNPASFGCHFNRGTCNRNLGDLQRAEADFRKSAELDPEYAVPWEELGDCLARQDKTKEAVAAFSKAIELAPDSASGYLGLAEIAFYADESEDAFFNALKAIEKEPELERAHYVAGYAAYELSKWQIAVKHLSVVLASGSEDSDDTLWRMRAECYQELNQNKLAMADLARADQINVPLHADDLKLLELMATADADAFIASVSPKLAPYLDRPAVAARLSQIASQLPDIDLEMRKSVEPHPTIGRMETRVVFRSAGDAEANAVFMLILRDKTFSLLGIEIRGPGFSTTTLDALTGVERIAKDTEQLMNAVFEGDLDAAMALLPGESTRSEHITQFMNSIRQMFGSAKDVSLQDVIITPPSRTEGEPRISVFTVIEKESEQLFLASENRFAIDDDLTQVEMKIGESVQADYVSRSTQSAERFARVCKTGSLEKFAALFLEEDQAETVSDQLLGVYLTALKESSGKFAAIVPSSVSNLVAIETQNMVRKVNFTARFENYDLPMQIEELFGRVVSFRFLNDESDFDWMNTTVLRDHWQPLAKKDLDVFGNGAATETVKMFKSYGGFDSVTAAQVEDIQGSFRGDLGEIQAIRGTGASYDAARWTYTFDVIGSKGQGVGTVVFAQSGFQRRLINIGIRVK